MTPSLGLVYFRSVRPRAARTYLAFAEQELVLPGGPRKGMRYSADFMPFSRGVFAEFDRGRYTDFYGSGPVQSGKTWHFYNVPALYHLFELEEDVILGAPIMEMAKAIYQERLLPSIEMTRYRDLLPRSGGGSRGGVADSIRFGNGASVRFLGAGGGDQQIASYTARVVVATELDKMDTPGKVSREADPVTKLKARTRAFGRAARFYGECTMTTKAGRIYHEVVEMGTDSRVFLPCPHCRTWILPERSHLVGWHEAPDEMQAREKASFTCPACAQPWTEAERRKSLADPRVVARGQTVDEAGNVVGEMPRTLTYGFRWNAVASPLLTLADIAADEWRAEQLGTVAARKAIAQHVWAEPYEEEIEDLARPDVVMVLSKIVGYERGAIPEGTLRLTLAIDVGSYVLWWSLWSWLPGARGHVVDFGALDVPLVNGVKNPTAVLGALRTFRDNHVIPGWGGRQPDLGLVDAGYEQEVVYQFIRESGPRWRPCKGFGTSSRNGVWKSAPATETTEKRMVGQEWQQTLQPSGVYLIAVHADHWKAAVHDGFAAAAGAPGSLSIFKGAHEDPEMRRFARQIVAEERQIKTVGEKEPRVVWVVRQRQNHWLDTAAYARCAADMLGIKLAVPAGAAPRPRVPAPGMRPHQQRPGQHGIRTRY